MFGGVVAWRLLFLDSGIEDGYVASADFSAGYLARQLAGVYYFNFIEQPLDVLTADVPFLLKFGLISLGLAVIAAVLLAVPVLIFGFRVPRSSGETAARSRVNGEIRFYLDVALAGLLLTGLVLNVGLVFHWFGQELGPLNVQATMRTALWGFTTMVLGVQTIHGSFFLSMLGMARKAE